MGAQAKAAGEKGGNNMKCEKIKCFTCKGEGLWTAQAIQTPVGILAAREIDCLSCGGFGFVVRETEEAEERSERMTAMAHAPVNKSAHERMTKAAREQRLSITSRRT